MPNLVASKCLVGCRASKIPSTQCSLSFEGAVFIQPNILGRCIKSCLFCNTHQVAIIVCSAYFFAQLVVIACFLQECHCLLSSLGRVVEGKRLNFFKHDYFAEIGNYFAMDLTQVAARKYNLSIYTIS